MKNTCLFSFFLMLLILSGCGNEDEVTSQITLNNRGTEWKERSPVQATLYGETLEVQGLLSNTADINASIYLRFDLGDGIGQIKLNEGIENIAIWGQNGFLQEFRIGRNSDQQQITNVVLDAESQEISFDFIFESINVSNETTFEIVEGRCERIPYVNEAALQGVAFHEGASRSWYGISTEVEEIDENYTITLQSSLGDSEYLTLILPNNISVGTYNLVDNPELLTFGDFVLGPEDKKEGFISVTENNNETRTISGEYEVAKYYPSSASPLQYSDGSYIIHY